MITCIYICLQMVTARQKFDNWQCIYRYDSAFPIIVPIFIFEKKNGYVFYNCGHYEKFKQRYRKPCFFFQKNGHTLIGNALVLKRLGIFRNRNIIGEYYVRIVRKFASFLKNFVMFQSDGFNKSVGQPFHFLYFTFQY